MTVHRSLSSAAGHAPEWNKTMVPVATACDVAGIGPGPVLWTQKGLKV